LDSFKKIYDLSVDKQHKRVPMIERYLGIGEPAFVSVDDRRNEPAFYQELAQNNGRELQDCLRWLTGELRAVSFEQSGGILAGFDFLQAVIADVLWRYGLHVGEELERFTREFDRLDVTDERRRLYQRAQQGELLG